MVIRHITLFVAALLVALPNAAFATWNAPVLYPRDNALHYAYGYSNIDWPVVYVQRGHVCTIMLEPGETLIKDANAVVLDDRVRWVSETSFSGGQNTKTVWTVGVEPAKDASDAWLTIHTGLGRHYLIHLIPVDRNDPRGEHLIGFYYWHPAPRLAPRKYSRRQATERDHRAKKMASAPLRAWATP